MNDHETADQVERVLVASAAALDHVATLLGERDVLYHVLPTSMFLAFAAVSQTLRQSQPDQYSMIVSGFAWVDKVLLKRRDLAGYGKARRCSAPTRELALAALGHARKDIEGTNLVMDRRAARDTLLDKAAFEFCAMSRLLAPDAGDQGRMIAAANGFVAEVLSSGELDKDVIKIGG